MGRVCHGPSLYGPSLLWVEFVMGRVCYGPSCPVTIPGHFGPLILTFIAFSRMFDGNI